MEGKAEEVFDDLKTSYSSFAKEIGNLKAALSLCSSQTNKKQILQLNDKIQSLEFEFLFVKDHLEKELGAVPLLDNLTALELNQQELIRNYLQAHPMVNSSTSRTTVGNPTQAATRSQPKDDGNGNQNKLTPPSSKLNNGSDERIQSPSFSLNQRKITPKSTSVNIKKEGVPSRPHSAASTPVKSQNQQVQQASKPLQKSIEKPKESDNKKPTKANTSSSKPQANPKPNPTAKPKIPPAKPINVKKSTTSPLDVANFEGMTINPPTTVQPSNSNNVMKTPESKKRKFEKVETPEDLKQLPKKRRTSDSPTTTSFFNDNDNNNTPPRSSSKIDYFYSPSLGKYVGIEIPDEEENEDKILPKIKFLSNSTNTLVSGLQSPQIALTKKKRISKIDDDDDEYLCLDEDDGFASSFKVDESLNFDSENEEKKPGMTSSPEISLRKRKRSSSSSSAAHKK